MMNFKKVSSILITLLGVLGIACIASLITLCIYGAKPGLLSNGIINGTDTYLPAKLQATDDYGEHYINSMVFVGDKTIYAMREADVLYDESLIWSGIDGSLPLDYNTKTSSVVYSADGTSGSASQAAEVFKPQYIIITLGIENGVAHCSEEKFKEYYRSIVESITDASPETKIILQSVFPVSSEAERKAPSISNQKISSANLWIAQLADELSVKYLDTAEILKDKKGNLDERYDSGDGICLNKEGYEAVLNYIRCHGYR